MAASLEELDLRTGDVLLYRTTDIGATFNAYAQGEKWSHVSVIIKTTDLITDDDNPESSSRKIESLYEEDYKNSSVSHESLRHLAIFEAVPNRGVSLYPLEARLARTTNSIKLLAVRRLDRTNNNNTLTAENYKSLSKFIQKVSGRNLEIATMDMVSACCGWWGWHPRASGQNKENWDEFFCSELVAEALQQLGVIDDDNVSSNDFLPSSFAYYDKTAAAAQGSSSKKKHHKGPLLDTTCIQNHSYEREIILLGNGSGTEGTTLKNKLLERKNILRKESCM